MKFVKYEHCSCGRACYSEYPCFLISGSFVAEGSNVTMYGDFYKGFGHIEEGCTFRSCKISVNYYKDSNYEGVQKQFDVEVKPFLNSNSSFELRYMTDYPVPLVNSRGRDCMGYWGVFYFKGSDYVWLYLVLGFFPVALFLFCLLAYWKIVTPDERFWMKHFLLFPYYLVTDRRHALVYAQYQRTPLKGQVMVMR